MLLLFLLALTMNLTTHFASLPKLKHPLAVIAHRGGRALAPENTLAAFRNAIKLSADYVEIDVRATKDGHLVLMHDRTVDRTTNGTGAVKDLDFATIRNLDAGSKFSAEYVGEKVPTLEETLALCRGKIHIYLDHKEAPTDEVLALLKKYRMEKQVIVYNGTDGLKEWKRLAPHIPIMPSLPNEYRHAGGIAEYEKILPAEVLDGNLLEWTQELVNAAHVAGVKVYVDNLGPYDNPLGFRRALAMGMDGIQTDYPDQLIQVLREEQESKKSKTADRLSNPGFERRGRAFYGLGNLQHWERTPGTAPGETILTSPELATDIAANELVVSWNADTPPGTGLKLEARAYWGEHVTKWYTLGLWSKEGTGFPRESLNGQKDNDGDVATDTLVLKHPALAVQVRATLHASSGQTPTLRFVGISLTETHANPPPLPANHAVWGKELVVPGKPQSGWPGADGWCSPTSTAMALAFWGEKLGRKELDIPVPEAAHAIFDPVYKGTGNWPFNTAFAASFPGIRAYVTRLSDIRELEDWIAADIPPVVSVSYDLLRGKSEDHDPGHLMVCNGFTKEGDIVLNDPAHHPERGETARRVFPRANFLRAWNRSHQTVYLIYPENTKLPTDLFGHWESHQ